MSDEPNKSYISKTFEEACSEVTRIQKTLGIIGPKMEACAEEICAFLQDILDKIDFLNMPESDSRKHVIPIYANYSDADKAKPQIVIQGTPKTRGEENILATLEENILATLTATINGDEEKGVDNYRLESNFHLPKEFTGPLTREDTIRVDDGMKDFQNRIVSYLKATLNIDELMKCLSEKEAKETTNERRGSQKGVSPFKRDP